MYISKFYVKISMFIFLLSMTIYGSTKTELLGSKLYDILCKKHSDIASQKSMVIEEFSTKETKDFNCKLPVNLLSKRFPIGINIPTDSKMYLGDNLRFVMDKCILEISIGNINTLVDMLWSKKSKIYIAAEEELNLKVHLDFAKAELCSSGAFMGGEDLFNEDTFRQVLNASCQQLTQYDHKTSVSGNYSDFYQYVVLCIMRETFSDYEPNIYYLKRQNDNIYIFCRKTENEIQYRLFGFPAKKVNTSKMWLGTFAYHIDRSNPDHVAISLELLKKMLKS
ncbi:MAG: hypothetical protein JEZ07_18350 [Phycisphaerae bacterium]|nr:hypothetical protein [Phycisphaerae bacterium]